MVRESRSKQRCPSEETGQPASQIRAGVVGFRCAGQHEMRDAAHLSGPVLILVRGDGHVVDDG